jgi:hypothetical protein
MSITKKIINEQEVFAINNSYDVEIVTFGPQNTKVVIVDDFYKNPDQVRELALTIPPSYKKNLIQGLPGGRIDVAYDFSHMYKIYYDIIANDYTPEEEKKSFNSLGIELYFTDTRFCVNVMSSRELPPSNPHVDLREPNRYASGIFLNTPEECNGGTAFYSYKGCQFGPDPRTIPKTHFVTDSCGDWEMLYLAEMKYNRMIFYQQNILHSGYVKPGWFDDHYRLLQMFFI